MSEPKARAARVRAVAAAAALAPQNRHVSANPLRLGSKQRIVVATQPPNVSAKTEGWGKLKSWDARMEKPGSINASKISKTVSPSLRQGQARQVQGRAKGKIPDKLAEQGVEIDSGPSGMAFSMHTKNLYLYTYIYIYVTIYIYIYHNFSRDQCRAAS